ncbi:MAG: S-adenosylmethionine:tRNA ribosyltransferase-isomerase [Gemmatimonadaceae bacterium]
MTTDVLEDLIQFELPDELAAPEPPEARGLERDEVRLMVTGIGSDEIHHTEFTQLASFLERGDVLVVNDSATINASLPAVRVAFPDDNVRLHLSTQLDEAHWIVELRHAIGKGSAALRDAAAGERVRLPANVEAELVEPWPRRDGTSGNATRLWRAALTLPNGFVPYTCRYGEPIRYSYVPKPWPLSYYQTIFAREPGSAEMPSAGRPLSARVLAALTVRGVRIVALTLHTGVSSLESAEAPYPERYRVPEETAEAVNEAKRRGGRVIAVGTTVVRALETVTGDGLVHADAGWTDRVVTREAPPRVVDGLITGFHAPRASHLAMLEAFAGRDELTRAYETAIQRRYRWHEFGDIHFIAPRNTVL